MKNIEQHELENLDDEINFLVLFAMIWENKGFVVSVVLFFSLFSLLYAHLSPVIYRAEALVAPVVEDQSSGTVPSQLGIVANLAGVNLNREHSKIRKAISIIQSREFIQKFVAEHDLQIMILASVWDNDLRRNVIDSDLYDVENDAWVAGKEPENSIDWEIYKVFSEIFRVTEDANTGMITISIEWTDPEQAAQWVNWVVADINRSLKEADLLEANNAIAYLTDQISSTQLVEMQRVFYDLIESQMRTAMLADVREEYVMEVIDGAVVPQEKIRPRTLLIITLGTLLGAIIAFILLLFKFLPRQQLKAS